MASFGFRKLDVYQRAIEALPILARLADLADQDTKRQLRRAALSIVLNIAEGTGRRGNDQCHFFRIARGSAHECVAVLDVMRAFANAGMPIPGETAKKFTDAEELLDRVCAMLTRMIEHQQREQNDSRSG